MKILKIDMRIFRVICLIFFVTLVLSQVIRQVVQGKEKFEEEGKKGFKEEGKKGFKEEGKKGFEESKEKKIKILGEYKKVILGMDREKVIEVLKEDIDLEIDTQTDYGFFDEEQKYIVRAQRPPILESIFYQFFKRKETNDVGNIGNIGNKENWILYAMILRFNPKYNNYITIYKKLVSKYGEAEKRSSHYAVWGSEERETFENYVGEKIEVKVILNKEATVKIMDHTNYKKYIIRRSKKERNDLQSYYKELNARIFEGFKVGEKVGEKE